MRDPIIIRFALWALWPLWRVHTLSESLVFMTDRICPRQTIGAVISKQRRAQDDCYGLSP
jgi:hypothetical protein